MYTYATQWFVGCNYVDLCLRTSSKYITFGTSGSVTRLYSIGFYKCGMCCYQKGPNNKWEYDLVDRLMVELQTLLKFW